MSRRGHESRAPFHSSWPDSHAWANDHHWSQDSSRGMGQPDWHGEVPGYQYHNIRPPWAGPNVNEMNSWSYHHAPPPDIYFNRNEHPRRVTRWDQDEPSYQKRPRLDRMEATSLPKSDNSRNSNSIVPLNSSKDNNCIFSRNFSDQTGKGTEYRAKSSSEENYGSLKDVWHKGESTLVSKRGDEVWNPDYRGSNYRGNAPFRGRGRGRPGQSPCQESRNFHKRFEDEDESNEINSWLEMSKGSELNMEAMNKEKDLGSKSPLLGSDEARNNAIKEATDRIKKTLLQKKPVNLNDLLSSGDESKGDNYQDSPKKSSRQKNLCDLELDVSDMREIGRANPLSVDCIISHNDSDDDIVEISRPPSPPKLLIDLETSPVKEGDGNQSFCIRTEKYLSSLVSQSGVHSDSEPSVSTLRNSKSSEKVVNPMSPPCISNQRQKVIAELQKLGSSKLKDIIINPRSRKVECVMKELIKEHRCMISKQLRRKAERRIPSLEATLTLPPDDTDLLADFAIDWNKLPGELISTLGDLFQNLDSEGDLDKIAAPHSLSAVHSALQEESVNYMLSDTLPGLEDDDFRLETAKAVQSIEAFLLPENEFPNNSGMDGAFQDSESLIEAELIPNVSLQSCESLTLDGESTSMENFSRIKVRAFAKMKPPDVTFETDSVGTRSCPQDHQTTTPVSHSMAETDLRVPLVENESLTEKKKCRSKSVVTPDSLGVDSHATSSINQTSFGSDETQEVLILSEYSCTKDSVIGKHRIKSKMKEKRNKRKRDSSTSKDLGIHQIQIEKDIVEEKIHRFTKKLCKERQKPIEIQSERKRSIEKKEKKLEQLRKRVSHFESLIESAASEDSPVNNECMSQSEILRKWSIKKNKAKLGQLRKLVSISERLIKSAAPVNNECMSQSEEQAPSEQPEADQQDEPVPLNGEESVAAGETLLPEIATGPNKRTSEENPTAHEGTAREQPKTHENVLDLATSKENTVLEELDLSVQALGRVESVAHIDLGTFESSIQSISAVQNQQVEAIKDSFEVDGVSMSPLLMMTVPATSTPDTACSLSFQEISSRIAEIDKELQLLVQERVMLTNALKSSQNSGICESINTSVVSVNENHSKDSTSETVSGHVKRKVLQKRSEKDEATIRSNDSAIESAHSCPSALTFPSKQAPTSRSNPKLNGKNSTLKSCYVLLEQLNPNNVDSLHKKKSMKPSHCSKKDRNKVAVVCEESEHLHLEPMAVLTGHEGTILDILICGNYVFAGSEVGKIYMFHIHSNELVKVFAMESDTTKCVCVTCITLSSFEKSSDVYLHAGSSDGFFYTFHILDGSFVKKYIEGSKGVQCIEYNWNFIYCGTKAGCVVPYNTLTKALAEPLTSGGSPVMAIKSCMEGPRKVLVVASRNQPIEIRDAKSGLLLRSITSLNAHMTVYSLLLRSNLVYCGTSDEKICAFNFQNGEIALQLKAGKGIVCMKMFQGLLFASCYDGKIYIFDQESGELVKSIQGPGNMVLSLDVRRDMIICSSKNKELSKYRMPRSVKKCMKKEKKQQTSNRLTSEECLEMNINLLKPRRLKRSHNNKSTSSEKTPISITKHFSTQGH